MQEAGVVDVAVVGQGRDRLVADRLRLIEHRSGFRELPTVDSTNAVGAHPDQRAARCKASFAGSVLCIEVLDDAWDDRVEGSGVRQDGSYFGFWTWTWNCGLASSQSKIRNRKSKITTGL